MTLLIVTSLVGIGFHFVGNLEFKRELYPELEGLALFLESVTGVTPVFAPGSMLLLGLIGLNVHVAAPAEPAGLHAVLGLIGDVHVAAPARRLGASPH